MCVSKVWGLTAPIIAILMGMSGIIIGMILIAQEDYSYVLMFNTQYAAVIILLAFSAMALATGCIGVCAILQMNDGLSTAFWLSLLLCVAGFSVGAAVGLATPIMFESYGCSSFIYPSVATINAQVTNATTKLCYAGISNCTCYLNPNSTISPVINNNNTIYSFRDNVTYPISVVQCPNWTHGIYDTHIQAFQTKFQCSGWCSKLDYYLFSDVNRGIPQQACFQALANWFKTYSSIAYVPCFIFACLSFFLVVWTCVYQKFCLMSEPEYLNILQARSAVI